MEKGYKIFMVDNYDGSETLYCKMYDRIETENLVLLLDSQNYPCTGFCYYNDGMRYSVNDIKQSRQ